MVTQCDYLDSNVSDGTFLSVGFSALDIYLTELARWSAVTSMPMWRWKNLGKIVEATRNRPAYKRMLAMQRIGRPKQAA